MVCKAFQRWPEEGSVASELGQASLWVVVCYAALGCGRWACSPARDRPIPNFALSSLPVHPPTPPLLWPPASSVSLF